MPSSRKSTETASLAAAASDQIRAIVEAAEQAAAQIRGEAEEEASRIRAQAQEDAAGIRIQVQSDVHELLESIRSGLGRLQADLELLEDKLLAVGPDDAAAAPGDDTSRQDETTRAATSSEPTAMSASAGAETPTDADLESARLVALNMALDGANRDEVDRYLRENFGLSDRQALLDEVYTSVGG